MTDLDDAALESLLTAHLRDRAAQAAPRPDLTALLTRTGPPPDQSRRRGSAGRTRWLAVAAAVAGVGLAQARRDPTVEIRPSTTSSSTTASPAPGPPTTAIVPGSDHDLDLQARRRVPQSGVIVVSDGGVVRMLGPDGTLVASGQSPAGRRWPGVR
jgi:hypothetical protein